MEEAKDRRIAELEFVAAAYDSDEAWCEDAGESDSPHTSKVHRRLDLVCEDRSLKIRLTLFLPSDYPTDSPLDVTAFVEDSNDRSNLLVVKAAYNALPSLVESCRQVALESIGEEAVFVVLSHASSWIIDEWPQYCKNRKAEETHIQVSSTAQSVILGRRLIYSHHIISKIKRTDIISLSSLYNLTGYMKIGWPGIIIVEGCEQDIVAFYDEIRPWCWKYLVIRGEQQEQIPTGKSLDSQRRFPIFQEVEAMSIVAQHCREVGLEALFRTSMKIYDNANKTEEENSDNASVSWYGALVHVDHMNNGKAYRKWLRKTSQETDCCLVIKQCYPNQDYSLRPNIFVGIIGDADSVGAFLKRWRTSRVDEDSRGKPCLERQMSVVTEGDLHGNSINACDWDKAMSEQDLNVPFLQLADLVAAVGGDSWSQALKGLVD
jgi:hypothetical protein